MNLTIKPQHEAGACTECDVFMDNDPNVIEIEITGIKFRLCRSCAREMMVSISVQMRRLFLIPRKRGK